MRAIVPLLLVALAAVVAAFPTASTSSARPKKARDVPAGFVTTEGTKFMLDGQEFAFVGANSYWLPLLTEQSDVDATFQAMSDAGIKVVRTWGFNAINETELPTALATNLTYYQVWQDGSFVINDGPQGLQRLDAVVASADRHNIKLILTFTNNWVGYGGLDLYVRWITPGETHDVFFTNPDTLAAYQSYVTTVVNRFKDSPAIMAWELSNEARCLGDLTGGPLCQAGVFPRPVGMFYSTQSDFVRSLDPNHLITTGGEGQFYWAQPETFFVDNVLTSDYNFNGQAGEDFEWDLGLDNIDFGVYHMYPQSWYPQLDFPGSNFSIADWGMDWINTHVSTANMVGKPLVLEEFGLVGHDNKTSIYPQWVQLALDTKHAGIMPWQFGMLGLTESGGNRLIKYADEILDGASPNDGYAIYSNDTEVFNIFVNAAQVQNSRSV